LLLGYAVMGITCAFAVARRCEMSTGLWLVTILLWPAILVLAGYARGLEE